MLTLSPGAAPALVALIQGSGPAAVATEEVGNVPDLDIALAHRGPRARVLLPRTLSRSDRRIVTALVCAGVQIRDLSAPYVHAKLIVTPTRTWLGSQNLSPVSLNDNREVGLITPSTAIHQQALGWFNQWWTDAPPWPRPDRCASGGV